MLENYHKKAVPFTCISDMKMFTVKCYRCGEPVVQAVDWSHMLGVYHPRQLAACGDCIQIFIAQDLPGVRDIAHQSRGVFLTMEK